MWAKDANDDEFDTFMDLCKELRLNPARKQIYCLICNKDNCEKRSMVIIVGIDGLRALAARCGDYRPDSDVPITVYDEALVDPVCNPKGIVSATARCFKRDAVSGEWFAVTAIAYWEAYAPIKEVWEYSQEQGRRVPTGRFELDKSNSFWSRMPEHMLAKCAEALALRKGWPEDLSAVHAAEEIDAQGEIIEGTATEVIRDYEEAERLARIGASKDELAILWEYSRPAEFVAMGQFADACIARIRGWDRAEIDWFRNSNQDVLQRFWARHKSDALAVKEAMEDRLRALADIAA